MTVCKEASTWHIVWIASLAGIFARWAWLRLDWRCCSCVCNSHLSQGQNPQLVEASPNRFGSPVGKWHQPGGDRYAGDRGRDF